MTEPERPPQSLRDPRTLRQLLQQLEETDVDELEVVSGSTRLYLKREPGTRSVFVAGSGSSQRPAHDGVALPAPLTGVFFQRPSPDQQAFVRVGDTVETGQVVGLIETMKLFNEVLAETPGEVVSISVEDGALVEAGQPLLYVRPVEGEQT